MAWDTSPEGVRRRRTRRPFLIAAAIGWLGILLMQFPGLGDTHSAPSMMSAEHMHMEMHGQSDLAAMAPEHHHGFGSFTAMWLLMVVAMMAPMAIAQVRHVREQSFARRRTQATAEFLAAYAVVAVVVGLLSWAVWSLSGGGALGAMAVGAALVGWQVTPAKQVCLNGHTLMPSLRAFSPGARRDAVRFGLRSAVLAFGGCWAFMLLPMYLGSWQLPAMVVASAWIWAEQFEYPTPARWGWHVPVRGLSLPLVVARIATHHRRHGRGRRTAVATATP